VGERFVRADGNRHRNRSDCSTDLSACGPTFPGNQLAATAANFAVNFAVNFDDIESLCAASHRVASCDLLDACESGEIDDATGAELRAKLRGAGLAAGTSQSSSRRRPVRRKGYSFLNRTVTDHASHRLNHLLGLAGGQNVVGIAEDSEGLLYARSLRHSVPIRPIPIRTVRFRVMKWKLLFRSMWRSRPAGLQPPIVDRDNINQRFRVPPLHSAFTGKGFAGQRSVLRPESAQTNPDQPIERIGAKVRSRPQHQSIDS
jgi:hypothetical protein